MQKLVNLESASSFMKGKYGIGMRFIPKILEQLKGLPEPVQLAVIRLLYVGLITSGLTSIAWAVCAVFIHR